MTFKDIYLIPAPFSNVRSRADVNTSVTIGNDTLNVPIIASNMDTVYSPDLAKTLAKAGGRAVTHRFCNIQDNVTSFKQGIYIDHTTGDTVLPWVSVGVSEAEFERVGALVEAGAKTFVIDVANAASIQTVEQYNRIRKLYNVTLIVGNFDNSNQIKAFLERVDVKPDAVKVSIGGGSACLTERTATGTGSPNVECLLSCKEAGIPIIFDGGFDSPASVCKAIALGATAVMMGRQFASTYESPGLLHTNIDGKYVENKYTGQYKPYRGSASLDSYKVQGKVSSFRIPEGESTFVQVTGSVSDVVRTYQNGLRSAMSYANAHTVKEFHRNASWGKK